QHGMDHADELVGVAVVGQEEDGRWRGSVHLRPPGPACQGTVPPPRRRDRPTVAQGARSSI
ncbi:MAG TPA: hypothetical protein VII19_06395, partial [Acidimicrobiales bacterium]